VVSDPYGDALDYGDLDSFSVRIIKCCPRCHLYYLIDDRHVCLGPQPPRLCECGCGQPTAPQLNGRMYSRWRRGHSRRPRAASVGVPYGLE
jgi:hypothetical protein